MAAVLAPSSLGRDRTLTRPQIDSDGCCQVDRHQMRMRIQYFIGQAVESSSHSQRTTTSPSSTSSSSSSSAPAEDPLPAWAASVSRGPEAPGRANSQATLQSSPVQGMDAQQWPATATISGSEIQLRTTFSDSLLTGDHRRPLPAAGDDSRPHRRHGVATAMACLAEMKAIRQR